ncbi:MAG: type III-A CRISPR-associated RAMP protein Csm5 [Syntrophobacteraceae bacterium]
MKQTMRCCLRILTPVHIGCDEVYEPTSFVIDGQRRQLKSFDTLEFLRSLSADDKMRFSAICSKGTLDSIIELYRFIRAKCPDDIRAKTVEVCEGLASHYSHNLEGQRRISNLRSEFNTFVVPRTAFNPNTNLPYVPGSSVKGALRTAYLNAQQKKTPASRQSNAKKLEEELLKYRNIETDPFKLVKVSDFMPLGDVRTRIVYGINRKKNPGRFESKGVPQIMEIVAPGCLFEGWISVDTPQNGSGITTLVTLDTLLNSAGNFYSGELNRENKDLQGMGSTGLLQIESPSSCLVRVGRHSGAECVTVEGHRDIRIMGRPPKHDTKSSTIWLASDSRNPAANQAVIPFGWAMIEPLTDEAYQELQRSQKATEKIVQPAPHKAETQGDEQLPGGVRPLSAVVSEIPKPPQRETWQAAELFWDPGSQMVKAISKTGNAFVKGKSLIPESIQERLCGKKRKPVSADVEVEKVGNAFKITRIEPL